MFEGGHVIAGRYRIVRLIGTGGMAEVYEARHLLTEHAVALKVLRPGEDGSRSDSAMHLELEAKIDARVGSPHIVRVQDAGVDEATGSPYLVMELLRGNTLERLIRESPERRLAVDQSLNVLRQVALGLDAAHSYSVVHRDLKPENVFVTEASVVKILDFGIAKILEASSHVTRELRGTPFYMAPEQAKGERVSAATDIWAFGLLAYRALTGRIYWSSANAGEEKPALAKIVYEITVTRPAPPSTRLAEQGILAELPAGFDPWFLRCIERNPGARFTSAGAAHRALESVFEGFPAGVLALTARPVPEVAAPRTQPTRTYGDSATDAVDVARGVTRTASPRALRGWPLRIGATVAAIVAAGVATGALSSRHGNEEPPAQLAPARSATLVEPTAPPQAPPDIGAGSMLQPHADSAPAAPPAPPRTPARAARALEKRDTSPAASLARLPAAGANRSAARASTRKAAAAVADPYGLTPSQLLRHGPLTLQRSALPAPAQLQAERERPAGTPPSLVGSPSVKNH